MISLEMATTLVRPPAQVIGTVSETPSFGGQLPSLKAATPFVTTQKHITIPTLNSTTPLLFPNIGGPNTPIHTTNESQQMALVIQPLTAQATNGLLALMHMFATPTNNAASGPSVAFQAQSYPSLVKGAMPTPPFTPYQQLPITHTFSTPFQLAQHYQTL
ncbi:unnamed protein product [Lactuca saligna]|uniref:Uncharacterized protein n=1 Tax=Lactuca saligna TaxID=75948 RepID=A0AA35YWS2_LACSI|nr:unnamed protein product [Lactuca saligna]